MEMIRRTGIAGAAAASGATIVIDTFRAFTTAAVLLARDIGRLVLTDDIDHARDLGSELDALVIGEDHGAPPPGFDLGNSPADAERFPGVEGRTVVQRTTAGTRSVVAALDGGAQPVFAASLVVASATARALRPHSSVTIVSAGLHGVRPSFEDDRTGDLIAHLLAADGDVDALAEQVASEIAGSERADALRTSPWAHPDDVAVATAVDRYGFAMEAVGTAEGLVELHPRR